jgi:Sap, sulfolipid-1-addressing protein
MGSAIGGSLIMAIGITVTPLAIAVALGMMSTARARINGPLFLFGWLVGLFLVGSIALLILGVPGAGTAKSDPSSLPWLRGVVGVLLLVFGVFELRHRQVHAPGGSAWTKKVENVGPATALGLGAAMAGARPKNILLVVAGVTAIAATGVTGTRAWLAYVVFIAIGTIGVSIPVVVYFALGERGPERLQQLQDWLVTNTPIIMALVCFAIGLDVLVTAIANAS